MQTPVHNAILNDIANQCLLVYIRFSVVVFSDKIDSSAQCHFE